MHTRSQDFTLGLVVLLMIGLFVTTVLFLTPSFNAPTRPVTFVFRQTDGVSPVKKGSPVLLSGALQIGEVTDVQTRIEQVDTLEGRRPDLVILVVSKVDKALDLFEDCEVTTSQPPVGGVGTVVIISVGTPGRPAAGARIRGLPPQSLPAAISGLSRRLLGPGGIVEKIDQLLDPAVDSSVAGRLLAIMADLNGVTSELKSQMTPGEQRALIAKLSRLLDTLNVTTEGLRTELDSHESGSLIAKVGVALDRLTDGLTQVDDILKENRAALHSTTGNLAHLVRVADEELMAEIAKEFDHDNPNSLIVQLHLSMEKINTSLENVTAITDVGRRLMVMNRAALQRTIENLKETSDRLRVGIQELLLTPWRLFQPPAAEMQRLDALEAARHFAEAATFLDDAASRLASVAAAAEGDRAMLGTEEELRELRETLKLAFERFQTAEKYFYEKLK